MKIKFGRAWFLIFFLVLALVTVSFSSFAQTDPTTTTPPIPLDSLLQGALGKWAGVISVFLLVVGVLRVVVKPILTIAEAIVKATPTTKDDEFLETLERGPVLKWVLYILDWLASVKLPGKTTANPLVSGSVSVVVTPPSK